MRKVICLSRENLIKFSKRSNLDSFIICSITDVDKEDISLENIAASSILFLKFDDVENQNGGIPMSSNQAKEIANFIVSNQDKDIIISCNGGVSRSAGIAAAINLFINDNISIFMNSHKCPNRLCFDLVLEQLTTANQSINKENISEERIDNLFKTNQKLFFNRINS